MKEQRGEESDPDSLLCNPFQTSMQNLFFQITIAVDAHIQYICRSGGQEIIESPFYD